MSFIATSICVDKEKKDSVVEYPQISYLKPSQRREVFWKCAVVLFLTSLKFNKSCKHILVTNDDDEVIVNGLDIKNFLRGNNVIIEHLE